jgi:hypothetical protein
MCSASIPIHAAPGSEEVLKAAGEVKSEEDAGPFGALAGLRDKLKEVTSGQHKLACRTGQEFSFVHSRPSPE